MFLETNAFTQFKPQRLWALFPVFSRLLTGKKQPRTHDFSFLPVFRFWPKTGITNRRKK
nr:MAG TPA: hypothetical protein [Caudoviricetes sp.]